MRIREFPSVLMITYRFPSATRFQNMEVLRLGPSSKINKAPKYFRDCSTIPPQPSLFFLDSSNKLSLTNFQTGEPKENLRPYRGAVGEVHREVPSTPPNLKKGNVCVKLTKRG